MNVCVVALGKIGLPLAVQIAGKGHRVRGADIDPRLVALVNEAVEPFPGEAGLGERLRAVVHEGRLTAGVDTAAAVAASEVVVVVVPLIVDDAARPDFRALDAANASIAAGLRSGCLVVYETTVPVGTTRQRFAPMLAELSGLALGDFHVAYSPERVFSGRIFADLSAYPKLVGGLDEASARLATEFYESVLDFDDRPELPRPNGVWDLGSVEAAEFAKVAETTYRDVNIALANQFARFADRVGVDVYPVIDAANSQPFSHIHRPGIAVGGHCIPVYPRFYLTNDPEAELVREARRVNDGMPSYAVERLGELLGRPLDGLRVAVLGLAYRGGVKEAAFSGAFGVVEALRQHGAVPVLHDPLYSDDELRAYAFEPYALGEPCDAAIIQADHPEYRDLAPDDLPGLAALVDGRRIVDTSRWPSVPLAVIGQPMSSMTSR